MDINFNILTENLPIIVDKYGVLIIIIIFIGIFIAKLLVKYEIYYE